MCVAHTRCQDALPLLELDWVCMFLIKCITLDKVIVLSADSFRLSSRWIQVISKVVVVPMLLIRCHSNSHHLLSYLQ